MLGCWQVDVNLGAMHEHLGSCKGSINVFSLYILSAVLKQLLQ